MYPEATLQDIYKGCFQDRFGPAHILTNRDAAKNYILREVSSADSFGGPYYEPCGHRGDYYRVNLRLVADGIISADELTDALMQSAQGVDTATISGWRREWHEIQNVVRNMPQCPNSFSRDSAVIAQLLNSGKYVMHHSKTFNEHYKPHYRIIKHDVFETRLLPKLKHRVR